MTPLRPVDRFQIVTTALFLAIGLLIVVRAGVRHAPIDSYGLGAAFVAYGLYRLRFILRALRRGRTPP
jgi:hypothetical protein